jgi:hypothetical protein
VRWGRVNDAAVTGAKLGGHGFGNDPYRCSEHDIIGRVGGEATAGLSLCGDPIDHD